MLVSCGTAGTSHDISNRISIIGATTLASFETGDLDGFTAGDGVAIMLDDGHTLHQRPHQGSEWGLLARPQKDLSGTFRRSIRKEFQEPVHLSSTPVAEFSIFTQEWPAIDLFASLTFRSGKKEFTCTAHIIPTLWRTVIFDLSECRFLTKQEIDSVQEGGHSVGTWCDNPHDGKPFDKNEKDDYAPIKYVRILGNEYRSLCGILWVKPTNFITDCGLHSASEFMNGDFSHGHCYWTMEGDSGAEEESVYLEPGEYAFVAEVSGKGSLFVKLAVGGKQLVLNGFATSDDSWEALEAKFRISAPEDLYLGIESPSSGRIRNVRLIKEK